MTKTKAQEPEIIDAPLAGPDLSPSMPDTIKRIEGGAGDKSDAQHLAAILADVVLANMLDSFRKPVCRAVSISTSIKSVSGERRSGSGFDRGGSDSNGVIDILFLPSWRTMTLKLKDILRLRCCGAQVI